MSCNRRARCPETGQWQGRKDSNTRPSVLETDALTRLSYAPIGRSEVLHRPVAAFLANVGVNSAHAARSPLFGDSRFVLLPIPERDPWAPPMLRLGDISGLAAHAPNVWRERTVHLDPDF